jgi:CHASE3 domain sensor protein
MDADQLVAEIARQTGIRLSTADPILAAAVINELLLDKALAKLDRQVQVQADRVTAASTQAVADAKEEAEALLTEAGAWLEARIKTAGEAAAGMVLAELRRETEKVEKSKRTIIRAAWAMAIVGLVVLCGLGGMALAALR